MKVEVADREEKEHTWGGAVAADGVHKAGSAKIYFTTAKPTLQPDGATTLGTADAGRIWISNATSGIIRFLSNTATSSSWVASKIVTSNAQTFTGIKTFKSTLVLSAGIRFSNAPTLKMRVLSIGNWNMDDTSGVDVLHGLDYTKIREVRAIIFADSGTTTPAYPFDYYPVVGGVGTEVTVAGAAGTIRIYGTDTIRLSRRSGGTFDGIQFNSTSFNRGYITIWYAT